ATPKRAPPWTTKLSTSSSRTSSRTAVFRGVASRESLVDRATGRRATPAAPPSRRNRWASRELPSQQAAEDPCNFTPTASRSGKRSGGSSREVTDRRRNQFVSHAVERLPCRPLRRVPRRALPTRARRARGGGPHDRGGV